MNRPPRVNVTFKVNLKYPDRSTFVERFSQNISRTGLFVRAQDPLSVGSRVTFDYRLLDGTQVLRGTGVVRWVRLPEESQEPTNPPGMGIEFIDLDPASELLVQDIVRQFGEGSRAPKRPKAVAPRAPTSGSASRAGSTPSLDADESSLLDALGDGAVPDSAMALNAEALAQMVAYEAFDADPDDDLGHGTQAPAPAPGWFVLDLAGTEVAAAYASGRTQLPPRLHWEGNELRVNGKGDYLPTLVSCLGQPWPSPQPAALARRLGVSFGKGPRAGEIAVAVGANPVPIDQALRAFAQTALRKLPLQPKPNAAVVVVPTQMTAVATRTVEALMQGLGFDTVRILPNALALLYATTVTPAPGEITLVLTVGALGTEIALLDGTTPIHPAPHFLDLGFWNADAEVHNRLRMHLLKQGVDVDEDPALADDLMDQITRNRHASASRWAISLAGVDLKIEVTSVARWLVPASERLLLMCDSMMRNHVPAGRQVKTLLLAGDEPLWPGVQGMLQEQLGLPPFVLAHGAWSRLDGARNHVEPHAQYEAYETYQ